jgi:hypothetical protein
LHDRAIPNYPPRVTATRARAPRWHLPYLTLVGLLAGAAAGMNHLTSQPRMYMRGYGILITLLVASLVFTALVLILHRLTTHFIPRLNVSSESTHRLLKYDTLSNTFVFVTFLGAFGVRFIPPVIASAILLFILLKGSLFLLALTNDERRTLYASLGYLSFLFLISGLAALIYQIVWQRVLYAAFGVNIESITIIVSIFMFGLGLGSLVGGILASRFARHAPALFLLCELGIGAFGLVSLPLIHAVARLTLHGSLFTITLTIFALLAIPTMLMGATLPILVTHLHRHYQSVGRSVGLLYFINTLGSAAACFLTADVLFYFFGQRASVLVAAGCNLLVGLLVARYMGRTAEAKGELTVG